MLTRRFLRTVHLVSTAWFGLCAGYVLILALRQAGLQWWVIFSLSGPSAIVGFLVVSLYLFAVFRGAGRNQQIEEEHPLSSTRQYMLLYGAVPFLGGVAGAVGVLEFVSLSQCLLQVAYGTMGATFLFWIVVDPAVSLTEALLPAGRRHRRERIAAARTLKKQQQIEREQLLDRLEAEQQAQCTRLRQVLEPFAERLVGLLSSVTMSDEQKETHAIDIGVEAWRIGGLDAMKQLYDMMKERSRTSGQEAAASAEIAFWWDGIGNWRSQSVLANPMELAPARIG